MFTLYLCLKEVHLMISFALFAVFIDLTRVILTSIDGGVVEW